MSWDNIPGTERAAQPKLSLDKALRDLYDGTIVELDASVAKGRAYLAVKHADGQVRPTYLLLERDESTGEVLYKDYPVEESPVRWPLRVAQALTTWNT